MPELVSAGGSGDRRFSGSRRPADAGASLSFTLRLLHTLFPGTFSRGALQSWSDSSFSGTPFHVRVPGPPPVDGDEPAFRASDPDAREEPPGHRMEGRRDRVRLGIASTRPVRRLSELDGGDLDWSAALPARPQFHLVREPEPAHP